MSPAPSDQTYPRDRTMEQREVELTIARFGRDLWKEIAVHSAHDKSTLLHAISHMAECAEIMSNCEEEIDYGRENQETDTENSPVPEPEA